MVKGLERRLGVAGAMGRQEWYQKRTVDMVIGSPERRHGSFRYDA